MEAGLIKTMCSMLGFGKQWSGYQARSPSVFVASFMESCLALPREESDINLALLQGGPRP